MSEPGREGSPIISCQDMQSSPLARPFAFHMVTGRCKDNKKTQRQHKLHKQQQQSGLVTGFQIFLNEKLTHT